MDPTSEILSVGDELLRGDVIDTNAAWLAGRLAPLGWPLARVTVVSDALPDIALAIRQAMERSRLLIIGGGLGPTDDDRTREALSEATGLPLEARDDLVLGLRERFAKRGFVLTPNNLKQAMLPVGAMVLRNRVGTAPAFTLTHAGCRLACLPGVPSELRTLFDEELAPLLLEEAGLPPPLTWRLYTFGVGESHIDDRLHGVLARTDLGPCTATLHYRTSFPVNQVILVVRPREAGQASQAAEVMARLRAAVRAPIADYVYAEGPDDEPTDEGFSRVVVETLREQGATIALAESCTGGLIGDLLTRTPGSSEVFHLGLVTYADAMKQRMLEVPEALLRQHGAVSREVVLAMATGVRRLAGSTLGLAVSGIAGPGGGSPDKPVGTVHFALAHACGETHLTRRIPFERQRVKTLSAHIALAMVLAQLGRLRPF